MGQTETTPARRRPSRTAPLRATRRRRLRTLRRHAHRVVGLALVCLVAAFVLTAARTPTVIGIDTSDIDGAAMPDPVRTHTSAPRITAAGDGEPTALPRATDDPASTMTVPDAPLGRALVGVDQVPRTGGYTDLVRRYFGMFTVEAIVIVQCESAFDPFAVGTNTNGTQDHGLFQINDVHRAAFEVVTGRSWDERYDAEVNTAFAAWLFDHAGGWGPWRCNRNLAQFDEPAGG